MTFDECIEKLKSESAEAKEILEQAELLAELCNEYGVEVKDGTGRIMLDGKDIDITSLFTTANLKLGHNKSLSITTGGESNDKRRN